MSETLTKSNQEDHENIAETSETLDKQDTEQKGYMDVSADEKIRIDQSVNGNLGNICNDAATQLGHLGREAALAGADKDTKLYIFNLMQSYEKQIVDARNAMANGENPLLDEAGLDELRQKAERDIAYIKEAVEKRQQIHGQEVAKEAELKELKERSSREQAERAIAQQQQEEQVAARQVEATQQTAQPEAPKEVKEQKLGFFERRKQEQVKQGASEAAAAISRLQSSGYLEGTYLSPDQQKALQEEINSSLDSLYQITSGESSGSESVVSRAQKLQERLENIAIKVKQDRGEMLTKEEQKRLKKM